MNHGPILFVQTPRRQFILPNLHVLLLNTDRWEIKDETICLCSRRISIKQFEDTFVDVAVQEAERKILGYHVCDVQDEQQYMMVSSVLG